MHLYFIALSFREASFMTSPQQGHFRTVFSLDMISLSLYILTNKFVALIGPKAVKSPLHSLTQVCLSVSASAHIRQDEKIMIAISPSVFV